MTMFIVKYFIQQEIGTVYLKILSKRGTVMLRLFNEAT